MDTTVGFSDSYENSNAESSIADPSELLTGPELSAFQLLSNSFESVFDSPETFYSDAKLVLSDHREIPFHRCVLSARSPFFKRALAAAGNSTTTKLDLNKIAIDYQVGYDSVVSVLAYLYTGRVKPPPKGVSDCADENCCHVACRPAVDFMLEVLYLASVFEIPELVTLYQNHLLDVIDKVIIEDTLIILKLANICGQPCKKLFDNCIEIVVKSDVDIVTLTKSLPQHIVKEVIGIRKKLGFEAPEPEIHVYKIHKALESDDVELVDRLLKEDNANLDEACALHFAVAYCDVNTATNLLKMELADVNHRNPRGYTALHVAAMRKEPNLIAFLLTKGANVSETCFDGRTALSIAKQVTKAAEYNCIPEHGESSPKGRLCVEMLAQPDKRVPFTRYVTPSLAVAADELKSKLIDLENRVQLAQCFFPMEAQVAMAIAETKGTCEFTVSTLEPDQIIVSTWTEADIERHQSRLIALSKTVDFGTRYFPRCSELLDQIMECMSLTKLAYIDENTPELRLEKRQRFMEIQDSLKEAFIKDKEELGKLSFSASSSSTSKSTAKKRSSGKHSSRRR